MADDTDVDVDVDVDVAVACRVLGVSRSGYYDWLGRPASARTEANTLLLKHITEIHQQSRETYGWPRVHAELTLGLGVAVNHKRVARLMREAGLQGLYRRRARRGPTGRAELANAIFEWIECWYNTERRHSSIGMLRPVEYEARYHQTSTQDDH